MSVIIMGMEMPKKCVFCPLSHWNKLDELTGCKLHQKYIPNAEKEFWEKDRPDWCPLVEVPPHGDLIDQNALKLSILNLCFHDEVSILKNILGAVNNAPVIIKSEEDEHD